MAPLVLGIETSCDETGVALVRGTELLADVTASSMAEHARYGGIIPEIAARAHLEAMVPTLTAAVATAGVRMHEIDAVAVAAGPGLIGPLTIGAAAAKALALALGAPVFGVNHVIGHIFVDLLAHGPFPERFIALVASGGHTSLLLVEPGALGARTGVTELGSTLDDAAGEAFDKVGRLLGLPYPGGPYVDQLAQAGEPTAIRFPRGLTGNKYQRTHPYDFSFSGLKTAVARYLEAHPSLSESGRADVAASFADAVVDVLLAKTLTACAQYSIGTLVIGGGFCANSQLRAAASTRCTSAGVELRVPPTQYCTDNGAMIAALAAALLANGQESSALDFGVDSALCLTAACV